MRMRGRASGSPCGGENEKEAGKERGGAGGDGRPGSEQEVERAGVSKSKELELPHRGDVDRAQDGGGQHEEDEAGDGAPVRAGVEALGFSVGIGRGHAGDISRSSEAR